MRDITVVREGWGMSRSRSGMEALKRIVRRRGGFGGFGGKRSEEGGLRCGCGCGEVVILRVGGGGMALCLCLCLCQVD